MMAAGIAVIAVFALLPHGWSRTSTASSLPSHLLFFAGTGVLYDSPLIMPAWIGTDGAVVLRRVCCPSHRRRRRLLRRKRA
ncbi:MAG: hypothetical protein ACLTMP_13450 [Eggerthella lenta]